MQFILTPDGATAIADLQERLVTELSDAKKVLWLVSGGSSISSSVAVMDGIQPDLQHLLTIMLIDERYGPVGHPNSNFEQLMQAGFNEGAATLLSVLRPDYTLEETAADYNLIVQSEFARADIIISQLGIGEDGHISGILPHSPAAGVTEVLVTSYASAPYERITTTFRALQAIDADYSLVFGNSKKAALHKLQTEQPLVEQPSQILKQLPEAYIYNDQIGDAT